MALNFGMLAKCRRACPRFRAQCSRRAEAPSKPARRSGSASCIRGPGAWPSPWGLQRRSPSGVLHDRRRQRRSPALRGRPLAFLFRYIRRIRSGTLTVLLSVLVAVTCSVSTQFGMKYLIDIVSTGPRGRRRRWSGARSPCCAPWWRPTICSGGSAAIPRTAPSSRSPATSGAICSAICPVTRRAYFAERLPGGAGQPGQLLRQRRLHRDEHRRLERDAADRRGRSVDRLHRLGQSAPGRRPVGAGPAAGRAGVSCWPAAARRCIATMPRRPPAVDGELVDVICNFNVMRAFGATVREQSRLAATDRTSKWQPAGAASIIWSICG